MKICPKCQKPNPDNSKKCFFCSEDLTNILPFVPEPISEPEPPEDEETEFPDAEVEKKEPKTPKKEPKKKIIKPRPDYIRIVKKGFIISAAILFFITVFIVVSLGTYFTVNGNTFVGIVSSLSALIIGSVISFSVLFMGIIIHFFENKSKNN